MFCGHFYFIKDKYFIDFPDKFLMTNKEKIENEMHQRPCFYAFFDQNSSLYWMIPISSQVKKYKSIYEQKIQKYKKCDTIVFCEVLGHKKAFLLQNMMPILPEYVECEYIDKYSQKAVLISKKSEKELISKASKILALHKNGIKLIFPDVDAIIEKLKHNS